MRVSYQWLVCYSTNIWRLDALLRDWEELFYQRFFDQWEIDAFISQCEHAYQWSFVSFDSWSLIHQYGLTREHSVQRIYDLSRKKIFVISPLLHLEQDRIVTYLIWWISSNGNPWIISYGESKRIGERPHDDLFEEVIIDNIDDLLAHSFHIMFEQRGPITICRCHPPMSLYKNEPSFIGTYGTHNDKNIAKKKAISESIERIALLVQDNQYERRSVKTGKNLDTIDWVVGKDSTGYATHTNQSSALFNAIAEHIERDSFLLSWLLKTGVQRVLIDQISSPTIQEMENFLRSQHIEIIPFITQFDHCLSTCIMLMRHQTDDQKYQYFINMACSGSFADSYAKCLSDCVQMTHVFSQDMTKSPYSSGTAEQHALAYLDPQNNTDIDWMLDLPTMNSSDIKEQDLTLNEIVDYYEKVQPDYRRYQTLTTEYDDLYQRVTVRVISPYILPFYFWAQIPEYVLSHPRLAHRQHILWVSEINTVIHPMT